MSSCGPLHPSLHGTPPPPTRQTNPCNTPSSVHLTQAAIHTSTSSPRDDATTPNIPTYPHPIPYASSPSHASTPGVQWHLLPCGPTIYGWIEGDFPTATRPILIIRSVYQPPTKARLFLNPKAWEWED
ncbi:hypothetical protein BKA70DRAFT_1436087 [Coprinopsis sp. MPI-PUGE-AT-0042]|nr:hypothetical protein BKA70DRAFT_1436087 [Coprinopsis sp. MPI-PUGE-AT-0042]